MTDRRRAKRGTRTDGRGAPRCSSTIKFLLQDRCGVKQFFYLASWGLSLFKEENLCFSPRVAGSQVPGAGSVRRRHHLCETVRAACENCQAQGPGQTQVNYSLDENRLYAIVTNSIYYVCQFVHCLLFISIFKNSQF